MNDSLGLLVSLEPKKCKNKAKDLNSFIRSYVGTCLSSSLCVEGRDGRPRRVASGLSISLSLKGAKQWNREVKQKET